jgi:DNA-binding response OmpR family regulator
MPTASRSIQTCLGRELMKNMAKIPTSRPSFPRQLSRLRPGAALIDRRIAPGRSVHVIESDGEELEFLCDFLGIAGLRVSGSTDPARAPDFVARMRPDVLICNLAELEMGGDQLLDRTRKASPDTRVILISNWRRQPLVEHVNAGSGVDLLIGPFNAIGLLRAVEKMLASKSPGGPGPSSGPTA